MKLIIFVFAGREYCMNLQLPYIIKILNEYPDSEYHVWNFARNENDNQYLNTLPSKHDRIKIFNDYYEGPNPIKECTKKPNHICYCEKCRTGKWSEPYKFYSSDEYSDCLFLKLDDDIVYMDLDGFGSYLKTIKDNPECVISANVINNGVCAYFDPIIKEKVISNRLILKEDKFNKWFILCVDYNFLNLCHDMFLSNEYTKVENIIAFTDSKISINTIGFNHNIMCEVGGILSKLADKIHDEMVFSHHTTVLIYQNFITSHLHFSDQNAKMSEDVKKTYIQKYKELCSTII